ncbi:Wiskott-Aldrich syndrome protein family member 2, partial [Geodia barretti]
PSSHYSPQLNYPQPPVPPPPAPPANFPAAPPPPPVALAPQSAGPPPPPPPSMPSEPGVVGEIRKPPPEVDQRSDFLLAIEKGMHLRKVEKKDDSKPSSAYGNDVASILKRRIAFEVSDTESEDEESEEEGSDEWSD